MKKITIFLTALALLFAFAGCTKDEAKNYEADAVADALNAGLTFGEALEKSTADAAYSIYGIDPSLCTNAAVYVGSGATADEIAVFNCTDTAAAETVLTAVNARIDYLREGYSDYGPDQVPKIESAFLISENSTIILCICENPEDAESVLLNIN